ncbi:hypothetical protein [Metaclostridioides mangenotii]|uniref:hypothetical protein n=1 Tax=Metaclostridioides mangenotii TaxID=1540 RepID=UPI000464832C|nr:hypothetical protein [Clostridioides mangenotii]
MAKRKTHEEFSSELYEKQRNRFILHSQYQNVKTKIKATCNLCGTTEYKNPHDLLNGSCKTCHNKKLSKIQSKSPEVFKEEVESSGEYKLLGEYIDSKTKCKIKHLTCGNVFKMAPSKFSYGQRCPKCMRPNHNRNHEEFLKMFNEVANNEYDVMSEFTRIDEKTLIKHLICGHEYEVTPHKFINAGRRCPKCAKNIKLTTEEFRERVKELGNDEYEVLGEYIDSKSNVKIKHKVCGEIYSVAPYNFNMGRRCPRCRRSKGEELIRNYLIEKNYKFYEQYKIPECKLENPLPFDFAIFKDGSIILIEYQGEQHYKDREFFHRKKGFAYQLKRDSIKREYCKANNIKLIEIPYTIKNIIKYLEGLLK